MDTDSIRLVFAIYEDGDPDQTVKEQFAAEFDEYPSGDLKFEVLESDHGIGADWPTVILRLVEIGGIGFFGIPAVHKKIRETAAEWKKIAENFDRFLSWLGREPVSYSIDAVFLRALQHLEDRVSVLDLEFIGASEIPGVSALVDGSFERSELLYYVFTFRAGDAGYVLVYDSRRRLLHEHELQLDPRFLKN